MVIFRQQKNFGPNVIYLVLGTLYRLYIVQIPYGVGEGFPYGCWWGNPLRLGIPYGVGGGIPYGRIQKT